MKVIPAIDIFNGKCVRLINGDYNRSTFYSEDPFDVAMQIQDAGIDTIHIVDLNGARDNNVINIKHLEPIIKKTKLQIQFGGGLKSKSSIKRVLDLGAERAIIGSMAIKEPSTVSRYIQEFGKEKIIPAMDFKGNYAFVNGWQERHNVPLRNLLQFYNDHASFVMCTDIDLDGTLNGVNNKFYSDLIPNMSALNIIAGGGVSSMEDIRSLEKAGCYSVVVGKAIYEKRILLSEIYDFNVNAIGV